MVSLPASLSSPSSALLRTDWKRLDPQAVLDALNGELASARQAIQSLTAQPDSPTWENFMIPLEEIQVTLGEMWSPVSHLHAVRHSPAISAVYEAGSLVLQAFSTWLETYKPLYVRLKALQVTASVDLHSPAQEMALKKWIEGLELNGIHLSAPKQEQLAELDKKLTQLQNAFGKHVIEATNATRIWIASDAVLDGVPASLIASMKPTSAAKPENGTVSVEEGWFLSINQPNYKNVMEYAHSGQLRKDVHRLYHTRASGLQDARWDNGPLLGEILKCRREKAVLLGYPNYASYVLKSRMLKTIAAVRDFQSELEQGLQAQALTEWNALNDFAKQLGAAVPLAAWDVRYYMRLHLEATFGVDDEALRSYFPVTKVLETLFLHLNELFDLQVKPIQMEAWHDDVLYFELFDAKDQCLGGLYLDLFVRANKQAGAWMNEHSGLKAQQPQARVQRPTAYITANFLPPAEGQEITTAYLSHNEIATLFHEMGHALQLLLTQISIPSVSGLGGIPWDAIEVASQLLETWVWDPVLLKRMTAHREDQSVIPQHLLEGLVKRKNAYAALGLQRQICLATFDMQLHESPESIEESAILQRWRDLSRNQVGSIEPDYVKMPHVFLHLFDGGYAAGYYSYLWSELLAANLFALFSENMDRNRAVGRRLAQTLYAEGGSVEPMDQFKRLYGAEPRIEHLLEARGIRLPISLEVPVGAH